MRAPLAAVLGRRPALSLNDDWRMFLDFKRGIYRGLALNPTADITTLTGYAKTGTNVIKPGVGYQVTASPSQINLTSAFPSGDFLLVASAYLTGASGANQVLCEWSNGTFSQRLFLIRKDTGDLAIFHTAIGYFPSGYNLTTAGRVVIGCAFRGGDVRLYTKAAAAPAAYRVDAVTAMPTGVNTLSCGTTVTDDAPLLGNLEFVGLRAGSFADSQICAFMDRLQ